MKLSDFTASVVRVCGLDKSSRFCRGHKWRRRESNPRVCGLEAVTRPTAPM